MKATMRFLVIMALLGFLNMKADLRVEASPGSDSMTFLISDYNVTDGRYLYAAATLKYPAGELRFVSARAPYADAGQVFYEPEQVFWMIETASGKWSFPSPILSHHIKKGCALLIASYDQTAAVTFVFSLERDSLMTLLKSGGVEGKEGDYMWIRFGCPIVANNLASRSLENVGIVYTERLKIRVSVDKIEVKAIETRGLELNGDRGVATAGSIGASR